MLLWNKRNYSDHIDENIETTEGIDFLNDLTPIEFTWKEGGRTSIRFPLHKHKRIKTSER